MTRAENGVNWHRIMFGLHCNAPQSPGTCAGFTSIITRPSRNNRITEPIGTSNISRKSSCNLDDVGRQRDGAQSTEPASILPTASAPRGRGTVVTSRASRGFRGPTASLSFSASRIFQTSGGQGRAGMTMGRHMVFPWFRGVFGHREDFFNTTRQVVRNNHEIVGYAPESHRDIITYLHAHNRSIADPTRKKMS